MNLWITILIIGLLTFAIRLSFILLFGVIEAPPLLSRALRFVPAAVLSAIILPELLLRDGHLAIGLDNDRLLAGVVAVGVAWFSKNVLLTIGAGMAVFVALGFI